MSIGKDGKIIDKPQSLAQIKGRGNSSWEASYKYFGKYAYNIKLDKKADVLKMGANESKSFCLLANNMDESLMRNIETYQAAAKAGMGYVPHYEVADVYNNGEYLGSYLVTEKVDVGKNKLIKGETVEDYHNDVNASGRIYMSTYGFNGNGYSYQYVDTGAIDANTDYRKKAYLLEFDLKDRAKAEHCWFLTPQGQYIAVKSPEDLNQEEMQFIIDKWVNAENAVYTNNTALIESSIDMKSFADVYLIQEFTKNLDSCATSYFVYYDGSKDNAKWEAEPIWDYDWALGGYKYQKNIDTSKSYANSYPNATAGWFAKYKYIDGEAANRLNFQAKLCENSEFWDNYVVKAWNSHMYSVLNEVFQTDIDNDYETHKESFAMNEDRYGFIAADYITSWGSVDTGSTPEQAYTYLKSWARTRLLWMKNRLKMPFSSIKVTADKDKVILGEDVTFTVTPYPSYYSPHYTLEVQNPYSIKEFDGNSVTLKAETPEDIDCIVTADGITSQTVHVDVLFRHEAMEPSCTGSGNIEFYQHQNEFYLFNYNVFTLIPSDKLMETITIPEKGHSL